MPPFGTAAQLRKGPRQVSEEQDDVEHEAEGEHSGQRLDVWRPRADVGPEVAVWLPNFRCGQRQVTRACSGVTIAYATA